MNRREFSRTILGTTLGAAATLPRWSNDTLSAAPINAARVLLVPALHNALDDLSRSAI